MARPKTIPTNRISYYINIWNNPDTDKPDNRVWVVTIDKEAWKKLKKRYLARGIRLRRTSGKDLAQRPKDTWTAMVVDNTDHARPTSTVTLS